MREDGLHGAAKLAETLVVARLLRDRGEQVQEVSVCVAYPSSFVVLTEQGVHDGEGDPFCDH